jgi:hypothetical protein
MRKCLAIFKPLRIDNLHPSMVSLIGRAFTWTWEGVGDDDEPYPRQSRWMMVREHDAEIPEEARGRWAPYEDLIIVKRLK